MDQTLHTGVKNTKWEELTISLTFLLENTIETICYCSLYIQIQYAIVLSSDVYDAHAHVCVCVCVCVCFVHWHCTAQLSMFNMEKRYRNKIIIIIIIINTSGTRHKPANNSFDEASMFYQQTCDFSTQELFCSVLGMRNKHVFGKNRGCQVYAQKFTSRLCQCTLSF